jgi:hypothetical protein
MHHTTWQVYCLLSQPRRVTLCPAVGVVKPVCRPERADVRIDSETLANIEVSIQINRLKRKNWIG